MDRPALPKQADRPSDEGLMTLSRGLGLGLDAARSASAPSSSASAPPAAASTAAKKDADEIVLGRAAAFVVGRESDGSQDAGSSSNGAERRATAGSSASAAATGTNRMPTTPTAPAASSSLASSSYQRRMPVSPLSRSLIDDVSDVDGPGAAFVRSPPSTSPSSTSPPSKTRHAPNSGFAAHDRSTTRSSRPMALPAPPPPPASQNRAAGGQTPLKSPCFVHGNLGHSVTLQDWLERRPQAGASGNGAAPQGCEDVAGAAGSATVSEPSGVDHEQRPLQNGGSGKGKGPAGTIVEEDEGPSSAGAGSGYDTDGPEGESLTRQLAETAVGVREMSKQLGRTRVRSNIQSILIITKARDNRLIKLTRELAIFLMSKPRAGSGENRRGHTVYVDAQLRHSKRFDAAGIKAERPEFFVPIVRRRSSSSASVNTLSGSVHGSSDGSGNSNGGGGEGQLRYWTSDMCAKSPHLFDFVVTLGGDGTVLFTSWLFQKIVPPVLPFALGSLGFLTNFDFADYASVMSSAIDSGIRVNLRMRFTCTVYRAIRPEDNAKGLKAVRKVGGEILMSEVGKAGWEALEGANAASSAGTGKEAKRSEKEIMCFSTRPVETFEVLNDLVVDRGPSPYVSMLELFGDEHHMTTVQADGLTISTPTGSTAYSLSAGGSLVHPEIPAILITPICPHTLSFRPMLLPDSMELRICVPYNSRSTAWASFDGRGRVELKQGDHIKVTASQYPFPTVCADKQSTDWFQAIQRTLRWNDREKQKSFVFVEEPRQQQPAPRPLRPPSSTSADDDEPLATPRGGESRELGLEHVDPSVDEDEDEETFDIDDSSTAAASSMNSPPQTPQSQAAVEPTFADGLASAQESHQRAQEPSPSSATSDDGRLPSKSGIQTPGRFADPLSQPHPAKLNIRHIVGALSTLDGSGGPVSNRRRGQHPSSKPPALKRRSSLPAPIKVVPRPEGEEGQRDDIHNPTAQRASKSKIPRSSEREQSTAGTASADVSPTPRSSSSRAAAHLTPESYAAAGQTPKPHERMRRHGSPRHHHSRHAGEQVSPGQDAFAVAPGGQGDRAGKSSGRAFAFFGADESESDSGLSGSDDN